MRKWNWTAIGVALAILTAAGAVMANIFATKNEMTELRVELVQQIGDAKVRDWKLQTLRVQVANVETRQQRTDSNVVRLLERFRVEPAPEPKYLSLPPAPVPADADSEP